jgi:hypothetical protein
MRRGGRRGRTGPRCGAGARGRPGAGACGRRGAGARGRRGTTACGRRGTTARGRRGTPGDLGTTAAARRRDVRHPRRRRVDSGDGRRPRGNDRQPFRESLGRGDQDRSRVRRVRGGASGRRADLRPRRFPRRTHRGDDRDAGRQSLRLVCSAGRARRDDRDAGRHILALRGGGAVGTQADNRDACGQALGLGRGGAGRAPRDNREARRRTDRAGRHGPRLRTRTRDAPGWGRRARRRTLGDGGPGGRLGRPAGRRGPPDRNGRRPGRTHSPSAVRLVGGVRTRDDSDPAGGHIRVRAAVRLLTPRVHVDMSGSAVRARRHARGAGILAHALPFAYCRTFRCDTARPRTPRAPRQSDDI